MATIKVAHDDIRTRSQDASDLQKFCDALTKAGHTVTNLGVGPNKVQSHMLSKSHSCDIMIQIAGGLCTGTLGDFIRGLKPATRYYYAQKGAIVYNMVANNLDAKTWKCVRSWDWGGRSMSVVTPYVGKTLPQVYSENKDVLVGFADGKNIDEVIKNFLAVLNGGSTSTDTKQQGGGSSGLDLIKQVCSDWDPYGVDLDLHGDTLSIKKTNPFSGMTVDESMIVADSVSFVDYDRDTPNSNGNIKDKFLINRFGEVPLDTEIKTEPAQILQMAQRGHNHTLELKTRIHKNIKEGNWINLNLPTLGIENRKYYISKLGYQEERYYTLTLDVAPPSVHVDVQEVTEEETTTDESTDSTAEEAT